MANANHHIALRVSDIDRAGEFYIETFDACWRTRPALYEGPFAEMVVGGIAGARFKVAQIGFEPGVVELFEFLSPVEPTGAVPASHAQALHFALQVDDVAKTLVRAEQLGATRIWPEVTEALPGISVIYIADPDGNVVELLDASSDELTDAMIAVLPSIAPNAPQARS